MMRRTGAGRRGWAAAAGLRARAPARLLLAVLAAGFWPTALAGQQEHVIIVTGLTGEPRFAERFATWSRQIAEAAGRAGVPAGNLHLLTETGSATTRSTRENVLGTLAGLAAHAGADDDVLVVLFGHGSESGGEPRLNLPGPDLTARDLAGALQALHVRRIAVVNAASASGGFVKPLAGRGRIVVSATKSGAEQNETLFGGFFAAALVGAGADVDKDGRVSLLEAFDFARREVQRAYESTHRLQTEHAVLDGDGDGVGSTAPSATSADGAPAALAFLGPATAQASAGPAGSAPAAQSTPELRALVQRKGELEAELVKLRQRKDAMPEAEYQRELERLLLEVSRNGQALRRLQGGNQ